MNNKKEFKVLSDMNTENFNVMRDVLSEIERNIMLLDPLIQYQFYRRLRDVIFEAWKDTVNPDIMANFAKEMKEISKPKS